MSHDTKVRLGRAVVGGLAFAGLSGLLFGAFAGNASVIIAAIAFLTVACMGAIYGMTP